MRNESHNFLILNAMNPLLSSILGWAGMAGILLAYFLNSFGFLGPDTLLYPAINLIASVCMGLHVWDHRAYPAMLLNTAWAIIALVALLQQILFSS